MCLHALIAVTQHFATLYAYCVIRKENQYKTYLIIMAICDLAFEQQNFCQQEQENVGTYHAYMHY